MCFQKISSQSRGIIFMIVACLFFSINNNLLKLLSVNISPFALVFYKNFISLLILLPIVIFIKQPVFKRENFNKYNIVRSFIDVISIALWFKAISSAPISQAAAVTLLTPFFISVIAIFTLKEKVAIYQWILMLLGVFGALIIIQPSTGFNPGIIYAVASSLLWATSAVLFKKLTLLQNSLILVFFFKVIKSFIALPLLIYDFQILTGEQIIYLSILGACANIAIYFVAISYKHAKISVVVPFDFLRLAFTAIIASVMFGEIIKPNTLYGSVVILIAATLLAQKARKNEKKI